MFALLSAVKTEQTVKSLQNLYVQSHVQLTLTVPVVASPPAARLEPVLQLSTVQRYATGLHHPTPVQTLCSLPATKTAHPPASPPDPRGNDTRTKLETLCRERHAQSTHAWSCSFQLSEPAKEHGTLR